MVYDNLLSYCSICSKQGHANSDCRHNTQQKEKKEITQVVQDNRIAYIPKEKDELKGKDIVKKYHPVNWEIEEGKIPKGFALL